MKTWDLRATGFPVRFTRAFLRSIGSDLAHNGRIAMRLCLAVFILLIVMPCVVSAQNGSIGLYADSQGMSNTIEANAYDNFQVYVLARLSGDTSGGITGAEFRIEGLPSNWIKSVTPNPSATTIIGDPFENTSAPR